MQMWLSTAFVTLSLQAYLNVNPVRQFSRMSPVAIGPRRGLGRRAGKLEGYLTPLIQTHTDDLVRS